MKGTTRVRGRRSARRTALAAILSLMLLGGGGAWLRAGLSLDARAAGLRQEWQQEERDGEPAAAIDPLRWRLDAAQRLQLAGVSSLAANPLAGQALVDELELASRRAYAGALAASHAHAIVARGRLLRALGPDAGSVDQLTTQQLARAGTPTALDGLTGLWQVEADMVPVDRSVSDRVAALTAVAQQARSLGLSDSPASDLEARAQAYQELDAPHRQQMAGPLLDALAAGQQKIRKRIDDAGLTLGSSAAATSMGCPTDVTTLLNRGTAPLSPLCAPGFRAQPALDRMLADMRASGLHPMVVSTYRSYQTQASLYHTRVQAYGATLAGEYTAPPGYSEHQLGLAVDLSSSGSGGQLVASFDATPEGRWLVANSERYGFILRYPADKVSITGYAFEPWHYRYVGSIATSMPPGITLEEYLHQAG